MRLKAKQHIMSSFGEIEPGQEFAADPYLGQRLVDAGKAERLPDPDLHTFGEARERWKGKTAVCLGSGPSLDEADCELVRRWREQVDGKVIAVNSTIARAPWADVLYFGDRSWWRNTGSKRVGYAESWTKDERAHLEYYGEVRFAPTLYGPSSGHQAISLAVHFGAARVILLGFDCSADGGRQHWHAPHINQPVEQPYAEWALHFALMGEALQKQGIKLVNCTRRTALRCYPRVALEDELQVSKLAA